MNHYHSLSFFRDLFPGYRVATILFSIKFDVTKKSFGGSRIYACIPAICFFGATSFGQTPAFSEYFNRAVLTTGAPTTYSITTTAGNGGARLIANSFLELTNDADTTANVDGTVYVSGLTQDFTGNYSQTLHSNSSVIEWAFNFRYNRTTNPSGLAASNYGTAIVLAGSNEIFAGAGAGNGYAVVYGSSGAPDPIRLVRYAGGLTGTLTTICSSGNNDISAVSNYVSVRATFEPIGDTWSLFIRDDGASNWADPSTDVSNQKGLTTPDNTYTSVPLTHFGFYWAYATAPAQTSQFDNFGIHLTNATTPSLTVSSSSLPSFGTIVAGSSSSSQHFTVSGTNLTDHITVSVPIGFEMRAGTNPFSADPIILIQTDGIIEDTLIDVRFTPANAHSYSGTIECITTGAIMRTIAVSGIGASTGLELFLTSDSSQADIAHSTLYPHTGIGSGAVYGADDWTYSSPTLTFYVVPTGLQSIGASDFTINWDASKAALTAANGNMFDFFATQDIAAGTIRINTGASSNLNVLPTPGKYLAKLEFTVVQPGFNEITITGTDIRFFDAEEQRNLLVTAHPGTIKFFLGDIASPNHVTERGDGKINFEDLAQLALFYFSESDGDPAGYKAKFDIGPTNSSGSYFAMPDPDGQIQFEDLAIFSIGYGKTAALQLPKTNIAPVGFGVHACSQPNNDIVTVPLTISGSDINVRALSISVAYPSNTLEYAGYEKCGEMIHEYCFMAAKADAHTVTLDAAVVGMEHDGLTTEAPFANLIFKRRNTSKNYTIAILDAAARDDNNRALQILLGSEEGNTSRVPAAFKVSQNYPNPFNPSTVISYELPATCQVRLIVFDMLGKEIAVLVSKQQNAGSYQVVWNGRDKDQRPVSSGMYFYRLRALDPATNSSSVYTDVKKMILLK